MKFVPPRYLVQGGLPLHPDVRREEVVAELPGGDAPNRVQRLERVHDHPVHLLLALVHLHLALLREKLPHAVLSRDQARIVQLLVRGLREERGFVL